MLSAIGLSLAGIAPIVTGAVGVWGYIGKGDYVAKTGEIADGPLGVFMSVGLILAGFSMMAYAIYRYRCNTRRNPW